MVSIIEHISEVGDNTGGVILSESQSAATESGFAHVGFIEFEADSDARVLAEKLISGKARNSDAGEESYTLAIEGGWGSGKTHFITRILARLPEVLECRSCDQDVDPWEDRVYVSEINGVCRVVQVMVFEAWAFVNLEQLIEQFLFAIGNALKNAGKGLEGVEREDLGAKPSVSISPEARSAKKDADWRDRARKIGNTLKGAAELVEGLVKILLVGADAVKGLSPDDPLFWIAPSAALFAARGDSMKEAAEGVGKIGEGVQSIATEKGGKKDAEESCVGKCEESAGNGEKLRGEPFGVVKARIKRQLSGLEEFRLVIVVDNLDRLGKENVRVLFQLMAAVADFPQISYLLAFDRKKVSSMLSLLQDEDSNESSSAGFGETYLEKVVSMSYRLPENDVAGILRGLFREMREQEGVDFEGADEEQLSRSLACAVQTPRRAYRLFDEFDSLLALGRRPVIRRSGGNTVLLLECALRYVFPELYRVIASEYEDNSKKELLRKIAQLDAAKYNSLEALVAEEEKGASNLSDFSQMKNRESPNRNHQGVNSRSPKEIIREGCDLLAEILGLTPACAVKCAKELEEAKGSILPFDQWQERNYSQEMRALFGSLEIYRTLLSFNLSKKEDGNVDKRFISGKIEGQNGKDGSLREKEYGALREYIEGRNLRSK